MCEHRWHADIDLALAHPGRARRCGRDRSDGVRLSRGTPASAEQGRTSGLRRQLVPGQIVASVLHLPSLTARQEHELGSMLRWGYGSAFGVMHGRLRRFLPEPWASLVFGGMLMTATLALFPLLGRTPPPWRWPPDVLATSFGTHVAYVSGAAAVSAVLAAHGSSEPNGR